MTNVTLQDVTVVTQTNVLIDDATQNFARAQANFVAIVACLNSLNPLNPLGPQLPTGAQAGIPLQFRTETDQNNVPQPVNVDVTSTATLQASLAALSPPLQAGEAVLCVTANPNAFGTDVLVNDALFCLVNNPTLDLTNTTQFLVLKGAGHYSVTMSERQLLDTATRENVPNKVADAATETTVTFYMLPTAIAVEADLTGGQTGSFTKSSNDPDGILYVRTADTYLEDTGAAQLYVEVNNPDGSQHSFQQLNTYTDRSGVLAGGDNLFEASGAARGDGINYFAGQTVRLWRVRFGPQWFFQTNLDVLRSIRAGAIELGKLDQTAEALVRATANLEFDDRFKLDQLVETSSLSATQNVVAADSAKVLPDVISSVDTEWIAYDATNGIFPPTNIAAGSVVYARLPDDWASMSLVASDDSVTVVGVNQGPSPFRGEKVWRFVVPNTASEAIAFFLKGEKTSISRINPTSVVLIDGANLDPELHDRVYDTNDGGNPTESEAVRLFHSHLRKTNIASNDWTTPQNPTALRSTLTRRVAICWTENRTGATPVTGNVFADLADPTIVLTGDFAFYTAAEATDTQINQQFPRKQSYWLGKLDIDGLPLTNDSDQMIGVDFHVAHTLPTGDTPLVRFGNRELIGIDGEGPYIVKGTGDGSPVPTTSNQRLPENNTGFAVGGGTGNTIVYYRGTGNPITKDFFALETTFGGNTVTYPLALTVRILRVQSGGRVGDEVTAAYTITDRDVSQSQTSQVVAVPVLPSGTANETFTFEYDGTNKIFTLGVNGISTNTTNDVSQLSVQVTFNDTQNLNTSNTTEKVRIGPTDGAVGNDISLLFILEPTVANSTGDRFLSWKGIVNGRQESVVNLNFRESAYDFSNIILGPDGGDDIAGASVQIYEWDDGGIPFDAPTHAELYNLWTRRDAWLGRFLHPDDDFVIFEVNGDIRVVTRDNEIYETAPRNVFQAISLAEVNRETKVTLPLDYVAYRTTVLWEFVGTELGGGTFEYTVIDNRFLFSNLIQLNTITSGAGDNISWNSSTRELSSDATVARIVSCYMTV